MSLPKEISFEQEICDHLAANGWLYSPGDAPSYDRAVILLPDRRSALIAAAVTGRIDVWGFA